MISFSEQQAAAWIGMLLWPFIRILALFTAAPVFSNRAIPTRVKVALAWLVAVLVAPPVPAVQNLESFVSASGLATAMQQVLIGFTLGFSVRLVMAATDLAGELIGLQMGLNFAGFFDPASGGTGTAITSFLGVLTSLVFVSADGHLLLLQAISMSFEAFPISDQPFAFLREASPLAHANTLFRLALVIALPFVALALFVNLVLGVVSRIAPQFNIFAVGFPATISLGLVGLAMGLPLIERPLQQALQEVLNWAGGG